MIAMNRLSEVFTACREGIFIDGSLSRDLVLAAPSIFKLLQARCAEIVAPAYTLKEDLVLCILPLVPHALSDEGFLSFYLTLLEHLLLTDSASGHQAFSDLVVLCDEHPQCMILKLVALVVRVSISDTVEGASEGGSTNERVRRCYTELLTLVGYKSMYVASFVLMAVSAAAAAANRYH